MNPNPAKQLDQKKIDNKLYRLMECYTSDILESERHILCYEIQVYSNIQKKFAGLRTFTYQNSAKHYFDNL